jgi:hypothetical protein
MNMDERKRILQLGNLFVPILCIITTTILSSGVNAFNSFNDSSKYPKLLSPAPFTFAIWGPIFVFIGLFYFYQARDIFKPIDKRIEMPYVHDVSVFFMLSTISTTSWYILWFKNLVWPSVIAMWAYFTFNLIAYMRLGINLRDRSLRDHLFITTGWSMLTAWVTVATIVNTTTGLVASGFNPAPLGEVGWTIIVLLGILLIYVMVLLTRNDFIFAGVGLWAVIGVYAARVDPSNLQVPEVAFVSLLGVFVLSGIMLLCLVSQIKKKGVTPFNKII